jgi:hypothetical protein
MQQEVHSINLRVEQNQIDDEDDAPMAEAAWAYFVHCCLPIWDIFVIFLIICYICLNSWIFLLLCLPRSFWDL